MGVSDSSGLSWDVAVDFGSFRSSSNSVVAAERSAISP